MPNNTGVVKKYTHAVAKLEKTRVLNIVRDLRDMIVSRYFHDVRTGFTDVSMEDFFSSGMAQKRLKKYIDYHSFWHLENKAICHLTAYESLLNDFDSECRRLLDYIDPQILAEKPELINFLQEKTAFKNQAATGAGEFFRKGVSGDWVNHLSDEMEAQVHKAAEQNNWQAVRNSIIDSYPHLRDFIF